MRRAYWAMFSVLAALAIGCAGPTATFRHLLPPDLPIPPGATVVRIGPFEGEGNLPAVIEKALRERLAGDPKRGGGWRVVGEGQPAELVIGGRVEVQTKENTGTRPISGGPALSRATTEPSKTVPTLVRSASMTVIFTVADGTGKRIADVESRQRYVSTDDSRVRGPDGLDRPDDPANVPPLATILAEQADGCAATFCRMIAPAVVEVRIPLRPAGPKKALAAAGRGDWPAAYAAFAEAADRRPADIDLQFNLAVAEEATGRLAEAAARFDRLAARDDELGRLAAEASRRVRLVVDRQVRDKR